MLGELDVIGEEPRDAGTRLPSMMAPTLVLADDDPRLVIGSAGSVRLAGAILQVVAGVVRQGLTVEEAIRHGSTSTARPSTSRAAGPTASPRRSRTTASTRSSGRARLFFGGASAVERRPGGILGAAGDPRRRLRMHRPVIAIRRAEPADASDLVALSTAVGKEE